MNINELSIETVHEQFAERSVKSVTHKGLINLSSKLILKDLLHLPECKCNISSVRALANTAQIAFTFYTIVILLILVFIHVKILRT